MSTANTMIVVREAGPADEQKAREISDLALAELRRIYRPSEAAVSGKAELDVSLGRLVAIRDGSIVATVQYLVAPPRLHLMALAVDPAHRKLGAARALVDQLEAIARGHGLDVVSLCTVKETGNPAVFERIGFRSVREQPDAWSIGVGGEQLIEVYMERAVRGAGRP